MEKEVICLSDVILEDVTLSHKSLPKEVSEHLLAEINSIMLIKVNSAFFMVL